MNPYITRVNLVTRVNSDVEMPDAEDSNNSSNNHSSSDSDSDDENTRDRILNWVFTARSLASQEPRFQLFLHHLR